MDLGKLLNWKTVTVALCGIGFVIALGMTAGMNEAGYRTIVRYPWGGLKVHFEPGMYLKMFGSTTTYPDAITYDFDRSPAGAGAVLNVQGIPVQYGDGGNGTVFGTARINLPNSLEDMLLLHREARGTQGVAYKVIKPTIDEAADKTAGLMNSSEGYQAKRNIFAQWAREQAQKGVYVTEAKTISETDPVTGKIVSRDIAVIKIGENGQKSYQPSALQRYGMSIATFQLQKPDFEPKTMEQIAKKRDAENAIITAKAEAEKAKQDAVTAEEKGKADLMKVRYENLKAKEAAVVKAEERKEVAEIKAAQLVSVAAQGKLEAEQKKLAAKEYKEEQILIGEGEAQRKRLVMEADGALSQKLDTLERINMYYAEALGKNKLVPEVMMGASPDSGVTNGAMDFVNMLTMKAAKDLAIDMKVQ